MILEYYITCYHGRRRSCAASGACRTGPQPAASGLTTRLGPGAWLPCLPAAAAAAAGVEPAGPRANPGRLEDAEEEGEDAEEEGDDDTDLRPLMADKDDGISCELGIRYPMLQSILSGDKNRQTIQAGSI